MGRGRGGTKGTTSRTPWQVAHAPEAFGASAQWPSDPTNSQRNSSWAVYHIRDTPAQFVGIVYDASDDQGAIRKAIEEFKIPAKQHARLIAQRRD